jgi:hypothetical protein
VKINQNDFNMVGLSNFGADAELALVE